ncbi:hypothetical protein [Halarchaeum sp. P4]|uniref:hypothetical protein n=1 Tax=Halarchaeum sp. P4 TaxID=3421639 RepID=UPI003EBB68EB
MAKAVPSWVWRPASKIRGVIFRPIVQGILGFVSTIIGGILMFGRGSSPGLDMGPTAVWGVEDVFLYIGTSIVNLAVWAVTSVVDALLGVNAALLPVDPGPLTGLVLYVMVAIEIGLIVEGLLRLAPALLSAIPGLSGVKTLLFGG